MTVAVQNNRISYNGNGSTQNFAYNYLFQENSDIVVIVQDADGVDTTQVLNTDYTITGAGTGTGTVSMTTAPASGEKLIIYAAPAISQEVDLQSGSDLPEDSLESALDKSILVSRYLNDQVSRSIKLKNSDTSTPDLEIPLLSDRISKVLGFDSAGDLIVTELDASSTSVTATGSTESRLLADRFADIANIKDFSGIGDGVTNNDTALAAAQASGADIVFFPAGDYLVTSLPTLTDGVKFDGPGRIVTSTTHRRTWELGGSASTAKAMTWYVDPTGNDANDGLTALTPFKTIQRAIDQLPNIIRHQQTIILSAGQHNTSDLTSSDARQWGRPALIQINGKWCTGRTNTSGSDMIGGIVIRGAGSTSTYIEPATGYTTAIMYVTGNSLFVALEDLCFRRATITPAAGLFIHKGSRVHGLNVRFDGASGDMSGIICEEAVGEFTNPTFVNGTSNAYAVLCEHGDLQISRSAAGNFDDASYGSYYMRYGSELWVSGQGTLQSPVIGRDSTLILEGTDASNPVKVAAQITMKNSIITQIYTEVTGTNEQQYKGCLLKFERAKWQDKLELYGGHITLDTCTSYISPATTNTEDHALFLYNNADYDDIGGTSSLIGATTNSNQSLNSWRTLTFSANNQTLSISRDRNKVSLVGQSADYTGCQISSANFGEGDMLYVEGSAANGVQLVNGTHMDLPASLTFGAGTGEYTGATFIMHDGKWRVLSLGAVR